MIEKIIKQEMEVLYLLKNNKITIYNLEELEYTYRECLKNISDDDLRHALKLVINFIEPKLDSFNAGNEVNLFGIEKYFITTYLESNNKIDPQISKSYYEELTEKEEFHK